MREDVTPLRFNLPFRWWLCERQNFPWNPLCKEKKRIDCVIQLMWTNHGHLANAETSPKWIQHSRGSFWPLLALRAANVSHYIPLINRWERATARCNAPAMDPKHSTLQIFYREGNALEDVFFGWNSTGHIFLLMCHYKCLVKCLKLWQWGYKEEDIDMFFLFVILASFLSPQGLSRFSRSPRLPHVSSNETVYFFFC